MTVDNFLPLDFSHDHIGLYFNHSFEGIAESLYKLKTITFLRNLLVTDVSVLIVLRLHP